MAPNPVGASPSTPYVTCLTHVVHTLQLAAEQHTPSTQHRRWLAEQQVADPTRGPTQTAGCLVPPWSESFPRCLWCVCGGRTTREPLGTDSGPWLAPSNLRRTGLSPGSVLQGISTNILCRAGASGVPPLAAPDKIGMVFHAADTQKPPLMRLEHKQTAAAHPVRPANQPPQNTTHTPPAQQSHRQQAASWR